MHRYCRAIAYFFLFFFSCLLSILLYLFRIALLHILMHLFFPLFSYFIQFFFLRVNEFFFSCYHVHFAPEFLKLGDNNAFQMQIHTIQEKRNTQNSLEPN